MHQSPTWMGKQGALLSHVAPQAASEPPAMTPSLKKLCALMDSMEWVTSWSRNWPHCIAMCDREVSGLTFNMYQNIIETPDENHATYTTFTYTLTNQFGNKVGLT